MTRIIGIIYVVSGFAGLLVAVFNIGNQLLFAYVGSAALLSLAIGTALLSLYTLVAQVTRMSADVDLIRHALTISLSSQERMEKGGR